MRRGLVWCVKLLARAHRHAPLRTPHRCASSAIVIHPYKHRSKGWTSSELKSQASDRLEEAIALAEALDWKVVGSAASPTRASSAALLGPGQVSDLSEAVQNLGASVIFIDLHVSPMRAKSLRDAVSASIVDRKGVILSIFEKQARTREAQVQTRLARLQYERARIVMSSGEFRFDQQRGGAAAIGGAGEQQIELVRRRLDKAIGKAKRELSQLQQSARHKNSSHAAESPSSVESRRMQFFSQHEAIDEPVEQVLHGSQRTSSKGSMDILSEFRLAPLVRADPVALSRRWCSRHKSQSSGGAPITVALAGYTNVGKTALARALCAGSPSADDFEPHDRVFATLDTKSRRSRLPSAAHAVLVDTVGFITELPLELVASFRSTLGEVSRADMLIHVRDASASRFEQQGQDVRETLASIGAPLDGPGVSAGAGLLYVTPQGQLCLEVWNKVDKLRAQADQQERSEPAAALHCTTQQQQREQLGDKEWATLQDYLDDEENAMETLGDDQQATAAGISLQSPGGGDTSETNCAPPGQHEASRHSTPIPGRSTRSSTQRLALLDQWEHGTPPAQASASEGNSLGVSAETGEGVGRLREAIDYAHMLLSGEVDVLVALDGVSTEDIEAQVWLFAPDSTTGGRGNQRMDGPGPRRGRASKRPGSKGRRSRRQHDKGDFRAGTSTGTGTGAATSWQLESGEDQSGEDKGGEEGPDWKDGTSDGLQSQNYRQSELAAWLRCDAAVQVRVTDVTAGVVKRKHTGGDIGSAEPISEGGSDESNGQSMQEAAPLLIRARMNPAAVVHMAQQFPGISQRLSPADDVSARRLRYLFEHAVHSHGRG